MRTVLLKIVLTVDDKQKEIIQAVYPRNLKLTSEYLLAKSGAPTPEEQGDKEQGTKGKPKDQDGPDKFKWCLLKTEPTDVVMVDKWKALLADADQCSKIAWAKGRIYVAMQVLNEIMPKYKETDFLMVHRKNDKGLWTMETWTRRSSSPWRSCSRHSHHSSRIRT